MSLRKVFVQIPKVYDDLSTSRVLTMEFVEGGQVNDIEYMRVHRINPFEVSDKLGLLYSEMIFQHGFVHSDPHPGNILVKKLPLGKAEIVLLDHGLYAVSFLFRHKMSTSVRKYPCRITLFYILGDK